MMDNNMTEPMKNNSLSSTKCDNDNIKDEISVKLEHESNGVFIRPEYIDVIGDTNADITVKSEPLELQDVFNVDGLTNVNSIFSTERIDDTLSMDTCSEISCEDTKIGIGDFIFDENTNKWKEKESERFNSADNINDEVKSENQTDDVLIRPEYIDYSGDTNADNITVKCESLELQEVFVIYSDDTGKTPFSGNGSEISREVIKPDIGHTSRNSANLRSADVKHDKREENKNILINRMKNEKRNEIKLYHCDVCSKCFAFPGNLNRHKLAHIDKKPYKCDVCNKCFARPHHLKDHKRTHTGEKPYMCNVCNKCFTNHGNLNVHKRTHTGEKPHKCDVCNKCFNFPATLNAHKRTHTGEKPYKCDVCNKCYTSSRNLDIHKLFTHTRETIYV